MKVAVSIPDPIFDAADALARRLKLSRSKVYALALQEFVANNDGPSLTEQINAALDEIGEDPDQVLLRAGARTALANTEW
jgi:metal-responsive CopG/Arc/MetJ family transcriptional regulator